MSSVRSAIQQRFNRHLAAQPGHEARCARYTPWVRKLTFLCVRVNTSFHRDHLLTPNKKPKLGGLRKSKAALPQVCQRKNEGNSPKSRPKLALPEWRLFFRKRLTCRLAKDKTRRRWGAQTPEAAQKCARRPLRQSPLNIHSPRLCL